MKTYRILICDVNIQKEGHWLSYNQYIVDHFEQIEKENITFRINFLFNKEASALIQFKETFKDRVHFLDETFSLPYNNFKQKYLLFKNIVNFAESEQIDHLIFMDFDKFQLPIFFNRFKFKMSGILFRPHHRIEPSNNKMFLVLSNYIKRNKKKIAEKFLLRKKNIKSVFILNDVTGVNCLNDIHKCNLFKYLPDPIFSHSKNPVQPFEANYVNESYKYLIFGFMDERKNITNILKAYDQAHFDVDTQLIIAGPATKEYLNYLESLITALKSIDKKRKKISIRVGFVSDEEMEYLFSITDVCLLIYKNFFGSSGLIGRAAFHKVKVIGSNVGLLSEMVTQNNLGITSDPNDVDNIAYALKSIQEFKVNGACFERFYQKNSPEFYLRTLLEV